MISFTQLNFSWRIFARSWSPWLAANWRSFNGLKTASNALKTRSSGGCFFLQWNWRTGLKESSRAEENFSGWGVLRPWSEKIEWRTTARVSVEKLWIKDRQTGSWYHCCQTKFAIKLKICWSLKAGLGSRSIDKKTNQREVEFLLLKYSNN